MSTVPSPPPGPKPGERGYDDAKALSHLLFKILRIPLQEALTGSSEIISALDAAGIKTFYKDLALLSPKDVMNLEVPFYP